MTCKCEKCSRIRDDDFLCECEYQEEPQEEFECECECDSKNVEFPKTNLDLKTKIPYLEIGKVKIKKGKSVSIFLEQTGGSGEIEIVLHADDNPTIFIPNNKFNIIKFF